MSAARAIINGSTPIPIPKVWEQMNLAYHYGADRIWIVNVGDLKPMEFPIEFFLTLAWDPEKWPKERSANIRESGPSDSSVRVCRADRRHHFQVHKVQRPPQARTLGARHLEPYRLSGGGSCGWRMAGHHASGGANLSATCPKKRDAFFELVTVPGESQLPR
jgi:hypothetical protein